MTFNVDGRTYTLSPEIELGQLEDIRSSQTITGDGPQAVMAMLAILVRPNHPDAKPEDFRRMSVRRAKEVLDEAMQSYGVAKSGEAIAQKTL